MDASASDEYRTVALLSGSGGLRTPAEKCRPPGYNQTARSRLDGSSQAA